MNIAEQIINLIAPHYCLGCDLEGSLLCTDCTELLQPVPPRCYRCGAATDDFKTCKACRRQSPLYSVWAVTEYEGAAKELMHKLKFERARAGADIIAGTVSGQIPAGEDWLVAHVPTATSRIRRRGYDQAELIARRLAHMRKNEYASLLLRIGQQRQVGQTRKQRLEQMAKSFRPVRQDKIAGHHILLVDDVLTTGATLEAAATTLKSAGARRVSAAVFAVA